MITVFVTNEPKSAIRDFEKEIAECIEYGRVLAFLIPNMFSHCLLSLGASKIRKVYYKDIMVFDSIEDHELKELIQRIVFNYGEELTDYANNRLKQK